MKKIYTALTLAVLALALALSSCDSLDRPGNLVDRDLLGTWELISADGHSVNGYQKNWLSFYKNGTGDYYYYSGGKPYSMSLVYDLDYNYSTSYLYIYYKDGTSSSMEYWFNSNATRLYMQWYDYTGMHTYTYAYVNSVDWAPAHPQTQAPAASTAGGSDSLSSTTDGSDALSSLSSLLPMPGTSVIPTAPQ